LFQSNPCSLTELCFQEWLWSGLELRKGVTDDLRIYLFEEVVVCALLFCFVLFDFVLVLRSSSSSSSSVVQLAFYSWVITTPQQVRGMTGLTFSPSHEALVYEFKELWNQNKVG
jgi:hypothetical protein